MSLKYSGIGSITISLVSTKYWVAEIGLLKLQIGTKVFKGVLQKMVSPNFRNEVLRISVSDTKHFLSGPVTLFYFLFLSWGVGSPPPPPLGTGRVNIWKKCETIEISYEKWMGRLNYLLGQCNKKTRISN